MKPADVLVVGAGPAGAVVAAALAERGWKVVLADRASFPRDKPCGDYGNPGAVRALEELGVLPEVREAGAGFIDGMTVAAQDGFRLTEAFPHGRGILLRRERLDAILVRRAERAGATLVEGFRAAAVASLDGGVEVEGSGSDRPPRGDGQARGGRLRARLLVACDGMRSAIAQRLRLLRRLPRGRFTVGAYFAGVPGPAAGELHLGPDLYGGVARFGDGTANVCLALPPALVRGGAAMAFERGLRALPALRDAIAGWRPASAFRVTGPIGFAAHAVSSERVLLAGDAAGQIEPLTGQGICVALRGGLLAAEAAHRALAAGDLTARALREYDRRRRALLDRKLRLLRIVAALAVRPAVAAGLLRRLAARPDLMRTLLGGTGDVLDPREVISPRYAARLLLGWDAHRP